MIKSWITVQGNSTHTEALKALWQDTMLSNLNSELSASKNYLQSKILCYFLSTAHSLLEEWVEKSCKIDFQSLQNKRNYRKTRNMYKIYALIIIFTFLYLYPEIQCKIQQEEETKLNYRLHFVTGILKELEKL